MNNPISISTGLVYRFISDNNDKVQKISCFKPDGVEVVLNSPESLFEFNPSKENANYLRSLKFTTIHAPACQGTIYRNNDKSKKILRKLSELNKLLNPKNITFHIEHIQDYKIFDDCDFIISIENSDHRKPIGQAPKEMERVLIKNPNLFFTFDLAHAMAVDPSYVKDFIQFKDRIKEIHVSVCQMDLKEHHFIFCNPDYNMEKYLSLLPSNVPLVTESVAVEENQIDWIKKEIKHLKERS